SLDLARTFDLAVAAGNVMILLTPGSETAVLAALARHLRPGGGLIAGLPGRAAHLTLAEYDRLAAAAGFTLAERFATWDREPWHPDSGYAVSVHRLRERADRGPKEREHRGRDRDRATRERRGAL